MNASLALPEIVLTLFGLVLLMAGVFRTRDGVARSTWLTFGAFVLVAILVLARHRGAAFGGLFVADRFTRFADLLILAGAASAALLGLDTPGERQLDRFEFPVLMLFSAAGMMVLAGAGSLMTLYMGLELQSLAIYVLCAFAREDLRSSEAGLKYFVLSALASGLLLYGISLAYGFAGSMHFERLATALTDPAGASLGVMVGIAFIIAGLAFKLSAVPFHMWTPDVYEGAPTPVTAFMSMAPKVAPFAVLLRVLTGPFGHLLPQWQPIVTFVAIASMLLGTFAALTQTNIKRLMAYSSISHMGYALIGLAAGSAAGVQGVLVYLLTYVGMSAGTFACIVAMRRRGIGVERIADLAGLARTDRTLALLLAAFMFSMAGVPPMAGFFGKLFVFRAAVDSGLWTLAIIGVLTSVFGAYYYLRIIKVMFFDDPEPALDRRSFPVSLVAWASGAFTLAFALFQSPLVGSAARAARTLLG